MGDAFSVPFILSWLRLIVLSTNLEYRARERHRKKKVGGRPAELNEKKGDRELERETTKETFFDGRTTWQFCGGGEKIRNASGHRCKVKMSGSEKKVDKNKYDISSMKRVTKKFLEFSRCSRAKQRQRTVQKSVLHVQSCFFANCCFSLFSGVSFAP